MAMPLVTVDDILAARKVVAPVLRATPVEPSDSLSRIVGRTVVLKPEHRQRTGSFKIRGAANWVHHLDPAVTEVVAASAGNHAQGIAFAANRAGKQAVVFMPETTPLPKVAATRDYGAEVRLAGDTVEWCGTEARRYAEEHGAAFAHPFDDPFVIAGQGTLGLELTEEAAGVEVVLVPVGGGGLIAGVATALRDRWPEVRIIGVEAAGAASMQRSLVAGRVVTVDHPATIADGIALKAPSELTLAHVRAHVDEVVTVSDEAIGRALILLLERAKSVVEPAGAVGVAALLEGLVPGTGPALAVLSGGNVDPLLLIRLIEHGLSVSGRFLRLRLRVPDRAGSLAVVASVLAELGLNILSVEHHRAGVRLDVATVEVMLTVESRSGDQADEALAALAEAGIEVDVLP
jgi:threonine dehydratase